MYGDVFENKETPPVSRLLGEEESSGISGEEEDDCDDETTTTTTLKEETTLTSDATSRVTWAVNIPECSTAKPEKTYGWDPWTKRPVRRRMRRITRFWCWDWHKMGWWIGFTLLLGSLLFTFGSMASLFQWVAIESYEEKKFVLVPYLLGGLCFFAGTILQIIASYRAKHEFSEQYEKASRSFSRNLRGNSKADIATERTFVGKWRVNLAKGEEDAATQPLLCEDKHEHHLITVAAAQELVHLQRAGDYWATARFSLDLLGTWILFFGVNSYNVMVVADFFSLKKTAFFWLVTAPTDLGGLGFVVGSYLLLASASESWYGNLGRFNEVRQNSSWWIGILNTLGSLGFLFGGIFHARILHVDGLVSDFVEVILGYFLGSLLFSVSSYLMILEIAQEKDDDIIA